jgi:hypothetical protein
MSDRFSEEIHRYRRTLILLLYLHTDRGLESSIKDKFARLKDRSFVGQHILQNQIEEVGDQLEHIEVKEPVSRGESTSCISDHFLHDQALFFFFAHLHHCSSFDWYVD